MIGRCTCKHPYQDQLYGTGVRVINPSGKKDKNLGKCTVCAREHSIPTATVKQKDKNKEKVKEREKEVVK